VYVDPPLEQLGALVTVHHLALGKERCGRVEWRGPMSSRRVLESLGELLRAVSFTDTVIVDLAAPSIRALPRDCTVRWDVSLSMPSDVAALPAWMAEEIARIPAQMTLAEVDIARKQVSARVCQW
jgi:hypothetical protein